MTVNAARLKSWSRSFRFLCKPLVDSRVQLYEWRKCYRNRNSLRCFHFCQPTKPNLISTCRFLYRAVVAFAQVHCSGARLALGWSGKPFILAKVSNQLINFPEAGYHYVPWSYGTSMNQFQYSGEEVPNWGLLIRPHSLALSSAAINTSQYNCSSRSRSVLVAH